MTPSQVHREVDTKTADQTGLASADALAGLVALAPGFAAQPEDPVQLNMPGLPIVTDEINYAMIVAATDKTSQLKRAALAGQIRALLAMNDKAKKEGISLADAARKMAEQTRNTAENAWKSLLEQNRKKEEAVRGCALFFSNMQDSASAFRNRIYFIDAKPEEIASDAGRKILADELSRYVHRPDPRSSRAYLIVQGWVGSGPNLQRLARVVHEHRAILITDGPPYKNLDSLRAASAEGGVLEALPGDEVHYRHTMVLANEGRARRRFVGRYAQENEDVYIPLSGAWFGSYLDNIVRGMPWKPPVGYRNPIVGIDGVRVDLLLRNRDGFSLYLRHRINPAIRLAAGSEQIVIWGPDALCRVDGGVQMGVAVVEMLLVRYAEWVVNQYGLLNDLDEAETVVRYKLAEFIKLNSGFGKMFRVGSRVEVTAKHEQRCLNVEFQLNFRELAERVVLRVSKPLKRDELGAVETN